MHAFRSTVSAVVLAVAAVAFPRPAAAADDYPVKFERPSKVGDAYKLTVNSKQTTEATIKFTGAAPPKQTQELTVALTGDLTVAAVSDKGRVIKAECKVTKLTVTPAGGEPQEPIAAGKTLVVSRDGKKKVLTVDGQPLGPQMQQALQDLISVQQADGPSEDEQFGTAGRKKPGDAWDGDPTAMQKSAAEVGVPLQKDGLTAKITFVEAKKLDGVEAGVYRTDLTAQIDPAQPIPNLPPGVTLQSGLMKGTMETTLPLDPAAKGRSESGDMTIQMSMSGDAPNGAGKLNLDIQIKQHKESTLTPAN